MNKFLLKSSFISLLTMCAVLGCGNDDGTSEPTPPPTPTPTPTPTPPTPSVTFKFPNAEQTDGITRAFPGAEGGGMYTTGGRGGDIYHVTSLADSSTPGTLRYGIEQRDAATPRTIVFDVCGNIVLSKKLNIKKGNLTIAGQTAPGGGVTLQNYTFFIDADNVIIRYLRSRMGDVMGGSVQDDAMGSRYHKNIIVDHCSMSWSTDECGSFYANANFTLQWCLLTESLRNSVHEKGAHGYGGIWGGKDASFHHNLLACHDSRNPRFDHPGIYNNNEGEYRGNVDFRNNVVYNWGSNNCYGGERGHFNMVNNYYKPGLASADRKYFIEAYKDTDSEHQYVYPKLYLSGNVHTKYASLDDNWTGVKLKSGGDVASLKLTAPLAISFGSQPCYVTTHTADQALQQVTAYAGAQLFRDGVDKRAANDTKNGTATIASGGNGSTGGMIDTQSAAGGWDTLSATQEQTDRAAKDADKDGIPDYYEELLGLDKNDASDAAKKSFDDRYTNLEMYLHYLVQDAVAAQVGGGSSAALK